MKRKKQLIEGSWYLVDQKTSMAPEWSQGFENGEFEQAEDHHERHLRSLKKYLIPFNAELLPEFPAENIDFCFCYEYEQPIDEEGHTVWYSCSEEFYNKTGYKKRIVARVITPSIPSHKVKKCTYPHCYCQVLCTEIANTQPEIPSHKVGEVLSGNDFLDFLEGNTEPLPTQDKGEESQDEENEQFWLWNHVFSAKYTIPQLIERFHITKTNQ